MERSLVSVKKKIVLLLVVATITSLAQSTDLLITLRPDSVRHLQTGETKVKLDDAFIHYGAFTGDEHKGFLIRAARGKMELVRWSEVKSLVLSCDRSGESRDCSATITRRDGKSEEVTVVGGAYFGGSTSEKSDDVIPFGEPDTVEPLPSGTGSKTK
ncbi:MAG: hypothetical protein ABSD98_14255 [Candidatus Korobacteraceae bacterium]|jgi:hypothetical protein